MCRGLLIIVIGVSASSVAGASPQDNYSSGQALPDQQPSVDSSRPDAEQLLAAARQHYIEGDLKSAVQLLQQAFVVSQDPNLLFNIAQVQRELHDCALAAEYYARYVEYAPDGERVADARKHIAELRDACRVERPQVRPSVRESRVAPVATSTETPRTDYWPIVAWVSFGTSALAAATTAYFAVESQSAKRDVERMLQQPPFDGRAVRTRLDDFYRDRNWATGAAVVTGITSAAGVFALIAYASERHAPRQTSFTVDTRGTSIDLRWRF